MTNLSNKIELYANRKIDFLKEVILKNDADSNGDYIAEWNLDIPKPTQAQLDALETQADFNVAIKDLRAKRNALLSATDYTVLQDSTFTDAQVAEWVVYRQALRDITNGITTKEQIDAIIWPTKLIA